MRGMYPKSPAERRWGIQRANILPPRGAFAVRSPQIMHGARILPPSDGLAPAQGLLPEQLHRGIAFQRLGPCPGGCLPPPAPRQPLLFKLNQTRPVGLGGSFRRKGTEHVKELRYGRGSLVPLQAAACLRGLRRALDSLHKLAAPDEQPKPRRAASCLRRKRLPNVRPDTLRLDRPHTPQPPARCR